jgi:hypothetical protein
VKRIALILLGGALVALPSVFVSGCGACACTNPLDNSWTPPPITANQAASSAAKYAGVPSMSAELAVGPSGRWWYRATTADIVAFVDGVSGVVIEIVIQDQMPNDATVTVATVHAQAVAEALLRRAGLGTEGLAETTRLVDGGGVAAYEASWADSGVARLRVLVNPSTGAVFAFVDLRAQPDLTPPIIGRTRAAGLAISALGIAGERVLSAELAITFTETGQESAWEVGLGIPSATQADVYEHGALVSVDAITGLATIIKS